MDDIELDAAQRREPGYVSAATAQAARRAMRWTRRRWAALGVDRGAYRTLWPSEAADYLRHLSRLDPETRRQRFHRMMSDRSLALHARKVFESPDIQVVGWFYRGVLRGAAEVAIIRTGPDRGDVMAEAAFAVEAPYRKRGVGFGLMRRAALIARNRNARSLLIATTWSNRAMLRLAMRCGARFQMGETEAEGRLATGRRNAYSLCLETFREEVGLVGWLWDRIGVRLGRLFAARPRTLPSP